MAFPRTRQAKTLANRGSVSCPILPALSTALVSQARRLVLGPPLCPHSPNPCVTGAGTAPCTHRLSGA